METRKVNLHNVHVSITLEIWFAVNVMHLTPHLNGEVFSSLSTPLVGLDTELFKTLNLENFYYEEIKNNGFSILRDNVFPILFLSP